MGWVDGVVGVIVVVMALRARNRGVLSQLGSFIGLFVGFVVGAMIAPQASGAITHSNWRPVVAVVIIAVIAFTASQLGWMAGSHLRRYIRGVRVGFVDTFAGMLLSVVRALAIVWVVAGLVSTTSVSWLDHGIQDSRILNVMDVALPPPSVLSARVAALFRFGEFPKAFAALVEPTFPSSPPAHLGRVTNASHGPRSVLPVAASGPCGTRSATGFFVGPHEVVTSALVVAGATRVTVAGLPATVALYDSVNDVAVLRLPALTLPTMVFTTTKPTSGQRASVVGYRGSSVRTAAPGVVLGTVTDQSRDIYNTTIFSRTVLVVSADVVAGEVGAPVIVGPFVVGMVVAKSYGSNDVGFALTATTVLRDVERTPPTGSQSTRGCVL